MLKKSLIFLLTVVLLIGYMVADENAKAVSLAIMIGAFIAINVMYTLTSNSVEKIEVILPRQVDKGRAAKGIIAMDMSSRLPMFGIKLVLEMENRLTGEKDEIEVNTYYRGRITKEKKSAHDIELEFEIRNSLCGAVHIKVVSIEASGIYGLIKKNMTKNIEAKDSKLIVMPDIFDIIPTVVDSAYIDNESIEYSTQKPGTDSSETFGIREYQPGDMIKDIHWKLTGKMDELIIRQPSLPLENSILLMFERIEPIEKNASPKTYDAMAEIYITLSQKLIHNGIKHIVSWFDEKRESIVEFNIESENDVISAMGGLLDCGIENGKKDSIARYMDNKYEINKAHIVYVCSDYNDELDNLPQDIHRTALVVGSNIASCMDKNISVIGVDEENYKMQLNYLEI